MFQLKMVSRVIVSAAVFSSLILLSGCATRHENSIGQMANSSGITFKVKESLMRDPEINSSHISVTTYKDTVTLSGTVKDQFQEDKAIEIARGVKGVKYVVDNLKIRRPSL